MSRLPFLSQRTVLGAAVGLWVIGLATGAAALLRYSSTPGPTGYAASQWPENAVVPRSPGRPTLVMLAHPQCPCTRASLNELARLLVHGDVDAWVLFLLPDGAKPEWEKTGLWKLAASIPGVHAVADENGQLASAFGAETSGHVLFYDANGILQFSGGITSMRGHEGSSPGGDAILAHLLGREAAADQALTFGCPLKGRSETR